MAKVKLNVMMDETMKDYIEEQSERLGVSQSGFINLCIAQYKEQHESVKAMNNLTELIKKIDRLQRDLDKKGVK